jgi:hypothetical protein
LICSARAARSRCIAAICALADSSKALSFTRHPKLLQTTWPGMVPLRRGAADRDRSGAKWIPGAH